MFRHKGLTAVNIDHPEISTLTYPKKKNENHNYQLIASVKKQAQWEQNSN